MKNKKNKCLPITTTAGEKVLKGACCAHCYRELNGTNGDSVWLESGEEKIRVCYEHILKLTNHPDSVIPAVPKNIKKFDPSDFLDQVKNLEKNKKKILCKNLDKSPIIRSFIEKLR